MIGWQTASFASRRKNFRLLKNCSPSIRQEEQIGSQGGKKGGEKGPYRAERWCLSPAGSTNSRFVLGKKSQEFFGRGPKPPPEHGGKRSSNLSWK